MELKRNIFTNLVSAAYVTVIGLVLLPLYLEKMGEESYGLIALFTVFQTWFGVVDFGFSQTIARETAIQPKGNINKSTYLLIFNNIATVFFLMCLMVALLLISFTSKISSEWLRVNEIPISNVKYCVVVMVVGSALRIFGSTFRAVILGADKHSIYALINVAVATLRFPVVFCIMYSLGFTVQNYFTLQFIVIIIELIMLVSAANASVPCLKNGIKIRLSNIKLSQQRGFVFSIGFTSTIWLITTQLDKLILSGILNLEDYAKYSVAVTAAGAIGLTIAPITNAIIPYITKLSSEGNLFQTIEAYRCVTQIVSFVTCVITFVLVLAPYELLFAWTGNFDLSNSSKLILRYYAIGNGLLAIGGIPYILQYAYGNMRLHVIGNVLLATIFFPAIIIFSKAYGAYGAGIVWMVLNLINLLIWVAYIHRRIAPKLHLPWLLNDVIKIALPLFIIMLLTSSFISPETRAECAAYVIILLTVGVLSVFATPGINKQILNKMRVYNGV